jgi:hypothetical protein
MKIKYILFSVVYLFVLTCLLLHPDFSASVCKIHTANWIMFATLATLFVPLLHFVAFLPLAFCFSQVGTKRMIWVWLILLVAYAAITEMLQEYIPPRAFRYEDLTQNIAGIIVGLFFGYYLRFVKKEMTDDYKSPNEKE